MPMTYWKDIVGYTCLWCGKWATHWVANAPICCSCHLGYIERSMEQEAIKINSLFQKGLSLEDLS